MSRPAPASFLSLLLAGLCLGLTLSACGPSDPPGTTAADPPSSLLDSLSTTAAPAQDRGTPTRLVRSQTLYVPSYAHIYFRDAQRSMNLTTTLSIRNTSPESRITLSTIEYYDSDGERVRSYLDSARALGPLASTSVVVEEQDLRGGVGANFIVRWHAETPVHPPVVETVMITTQSTQGISFRTTARVLYEDPASPSADTLREPSASLDE